MKKISLFLFFLFLISFSIKTAKANDLTGICFVKYHIQKNDSYLKLVNQDVIKADLLFRLNKVGPKKLQINSIILIPKQKQDWNLLQKQTKYKKTIVIDLEEQLLYCYEFDKMIMMFPISSGKKRYETPKGIFKVLSKDKWHLSGAYRNRHKKRAPMPWAVQFKHCYWIHQGNLPRRPASHSCVRLHKKNAKWLYYWADTKTLIKIY